MSETATVYVVDDDEAVRRSLVFLLEVEGLPARAFASADALLAEVPKHATGCIVTDLRMHGLDGTDLVRALPEFNIRMPAIIITGQGDAPAAARAMAVGAFDFIEKPFLDSAILDAVRAALAIGQHDPPRIARAREVGELIARLSERERSALDLLVRATTDGTLVGVLGTPRGGEVEALRPGIMRRLGAASLPALVRLVADARRYADQADGSL